MAEWRSLPSTYQQVEYLKSSGTEYIDTSFKPNQDTRVFAKLYAPITSSSKFIFGARTKAKSNAYGVLTTKSGYRIDYATTQTAYTDEIFTEPFLLDQNKNVTLINGTQRVTQTYKDFQAPCNLILFGNNTNGTIASYADTEIYSCLIYDNGVIVRDFVPCYRKSDSVAGLYDTVNGVFYTNAGTGTFAVGSSISSGVKLQEGILGRTNIDMLELPSKIVLQSGVLGEANASANKYTPVSEPLPSNTTALFHFNNNITDAAGLNSASWSGTAAYTDAVFGKGIKLNGTNAIKIPKTTATTLGSSDFTIAGWYLWDGNTVQTGDSTHKEMKLFSHTYRYNSTYMYSGLYIHYNVDKGYFTWRVYTSYSATVNFSYTINLPQNEWFHVAMVRKGGTIYGFYNGTLVGSVAISGSVYQNANTTFKIGACSSRTAANDNITNTWNGYVDEFIICKTALWTSDFTLPEGEWGAERKLIFQNGITGSTNIIEGQTLEKSTYGQTKKYVLLYDNGDECTSVTGGWSLSYNRNSKASLSKQSTYLKMVSTDTSGASKVSAVNTFDFSPYSLIFEKVQRVSQYDASLDCNFAFQMTSTRTAAGSWGWNFENYSEPNQEVDAVPFIAVGDISDFNETMYPVLSAFNVSEGRAYCYAVFLPDDWQTLCDIAGVKASSSLSSLIKSETRITAILASEEAVNFMCKQCTGDFMGRFVASADCMSWLATSPYKALIEKNEHWGKFLAMAE